MRIITANDFHNNGGGKEGRTGKYLDFKTQPRYLKNKWQSGRWRIAWPLVSPFHWWESTFITTSGKKAYRQFYVTEAIVIQEWRRFHHVEWNKIQPSATKCDLISSELKMTFANSASLQYHPEVAKGSGESLDWNEMKSFIIQDCWTSSPRWCPSSTKVKATWEVSQRPANILSLFLVILPTRATRLFNFGCTTCPIHLVAPCDAVLMFAEDRRTMFTPGEDEKWRMFLWACRWRIYIFSYGWWDRAYEGCVGLTFSPA